MLIVIDIGNSNIKIGVFFDEIGNDPYTPSTIWHVKTDKNQTATQYGSELSNLLAAQEKDNAHVSGVAICSGAPSLTTTFVEVSKSYFGQCPLVVGAGVDTGIKVLCENPGDVGGDRIADAAAAVKLYGGPAIVVDLGTAIVFDAITKDCEFMGGAIAPGIHVAADALFQAASELRSVELEPPSRAIGRNTKSALQSGLILGYAEMVRGMVDRFSRELGAGSRVIATGGDARLISNDAGVFDVVRDDLTLAGLKVIQEFNS